MIKARIHSPLEPYKDGDIKIINITEIGIGRLPDSPKGEGEIEVAIIPWADYAAIQAALAGAEKTLRQGVGQVEAFMDQVKVGSLNSAAERQLCAIHDGFINDARKALTKISAVKDNGKGIK